MPGGDGTGPWGRGPMTGRAMGYCGGFYGPRRFGPGPGGFGRGRGWRYGDMPDRPVYPGDDRGIWRPSNEEEERYLEGLLNDLEAEIAEIRERIQELKGTKDE